MDLQTVVAASMLPTSRSAVAAAFKALHQDHEGGPHFLELLWDASRASGPLLRSQLDQLLADAQQALTAASSAGIVPLSLGQPTYPPLLSCIVDPPPVLWARGNVDLLTRPSVAIVGSRAATPYALQVGARLAAELADRSVVTVSGLARGVDSAAHRGSLQAGGRTVAVQGCGVDRVYPPEHADLAEQIAASGVIVAELAPGGSPLPHHFPLRNRIISGISLAVIVVEASEDSGSLITARCAAEQGRDVMAVPGNVLSGRNRGSHALLKDGARVVETADDILQELGWFAGAAVTPSDEPAGNQPLLDKMAPGERYELDELAAATGMHGPQLLSLLTRLELSGAVEVAGGRYARRQR